jgi:hypothetical protein
MKKEEIYRQGFIEGKRKNNFYTNERISFVIAKTVIINFKLIINT